MSTTSERPTVESTPSPAIFAGGERRLSPRVPLAGAVKMGPPGGAPYAVVSATDLSKGGLFIDADRPVKVGARFSAEIELASGEIVYVPEAEVAYNRERATGSGFGVRFVEVPSDVRQKIDAEIERLAPVERPRLAIPSLPPVSHYEVIDAKPVVELPPFEVKTDDTPKKRRRAKKESNPTEPRMNADDQTLTPHLATDVAIGAAHAASPSEIDLAAVSPSGFAKTIGPTELPAEPSLEDGGATEVPALRSLDVTRFPEPILGDDEAEDDVSMTEVPAEDRRSARDFLEGVMRVGQDARHAFVERARRSPPVWTGVAALGLVTVLSAAGLTIWMGSSAEAVEVGPKNPAGMSATTQRVLMGEEKVAPVEPAKEPEKTAKPVTEEAKKPLPPLVVVDPASPEVLKQPELAADPTEPTEAKVEEPKVEPKKTEKKAEAKAEKKVEAKVEPKTEAKAEKVEAKTEKVEKTEAKVEPKKVEAKTEKVEKAEKVEPKKVEKAEKSEKVAKAEKGRAEAHEMAERIRAELKDEPKKAAKDATSAKPSKLKIPVGAGASVLKTHVFKAPDRFVIDVVTKGAIKAPAAAGNVKSVRVGKHADYTRIVIETKAPIDHGQVSKSGKDLSVTLDYLR